MQLEILYLVESREFAVAGLPKREVFSVNFLCAEFIRHALLLR